MVLFERHDRLGGQVQVAASVPSRAEFLDITRNLVVNARRAGVGVRTGTEADLAAVRAERPDVVVVATGARPARPWWAGDHPRVVDVRDVLEGRAQPSGTVVVVDELGFHQATSTAELLADRGCAVEIVTNGMVVGQDLGITLDLETWNVKAHARGIRQSVDLVPMAASSGTGDGGGSSWSWPCSTTRPAPTTSRSATGWCAASTRPPRTSCGASSGTPGSPRTGSATAWPPVGPRPRSSRATVWRWRCERSRWRSP